MPWEALAQGGSAELTPDTALSTQRTGFATCAAAATVDESGDAFGTSSADGSDVIVAALQGTISYPTAGSDIASFSVGTTICNLGTQRASWVSHTNQHPVISQNLFRLKDDRFEQIGMSWVSHGFYATSQSFCTPCLDYTNGSELGVGCSVSDSATCNAVQPNMSPRSLINPHTGYFVYPWSGPGWVGQERRLLVDKADLDPALNPATRYFVEGLIVQPDDCRAHTQDNNASYREVMMGTWGAPDKYSLVIVPGLTTQRGQPGVRAWRDADPTVVETDIRVPGEGLFILAAKATDLGTGFWRYEYALQNLNSHRSAASFRICYGPWAVVENVGFHDVDYHSGEIVDLTDWTASVADGTVTWSTQSYADNANALRFGTIYNFRFDANRPPEPARAIVGLFRAGDPPTVEADTIGPSLDCTNDLDADRDGEGDCSDLCPGTPAGACTCQGIGMCCFGCTGPCFLEYPHDACVDDHGTPDECGDPRCKNGCPLLDMDNDGDRDLADFAGLQRCFSGLPGELGHVAPTRECVNRLDVDGDHAIDLGDYKQLFDLGLLGQ